MKVGEENIKRREIYFVQDAVQDDHKQCDDAYAELNALEVRWKSHSSDIYSGNRPFCLKLFKETVCYLIGFTKSLLFLNKALFYSDFKHFQLYGESITGARYVHLEFGPCPDHYQSLYQLFLFQGILEAGEQQTLKSTEQPNLSVFSNTEKEILEFVAKTARTEGGKKLLESSYEEEAYKKTKSLELISYAFSKELKI